MSFERGTAWVFRCDSCKREQVVIIHSNNEPRKGPVHWKLGKVFGSSALTGPWYYGHYCENCNLPKNAEIVESGIKEGYSLYYEEVNVIKKEESNRNRI